MVKVHVAKDSVASLKIRISFTSIIQYTFDEVIHSNCLNKIKFRFICSTILTQVNLRIAHWQNENLVLWAFFTTTLQMTALVLPVFA